MGSDNRIGITYISLINTHVLIVYFQYQLTIFISQYRMVLINLFRVVQAILIQLVN